MRLEYMSLVCGLPLPGLQNELKDPQAQLLIQAAITIEDQASGDY